MKRLLPVLGLLLCLPLIVAAGADQYGPAAWRQLKFLLTDLSCDAQGTCDLAAGTTIGGAAIGGGGGVSDGDKGDVVVSGGGTTWLADDGATVTGWILGTLGAGFTTGGDITMADHDIVDPSSVGARHVFVSTETEFENALTAFGAGVGAANGHNPTGGTIELEGGVIDICNVQISGTSTTTARSGITIRGQGGGGASGADGYRNQGTILKGTCADSVLEVGGGIGITIENLTIAGEDTATGCIEILDNTFANTGLVVRNVGCYEVNGYGIIGNASGQWDTAHFDNVSVRDSLGCLQLNHTQSVGIQLQSFDCSSTLGTLPQFDIVAGEFTIRDSYVSAKTTSGQTMFALGETTGGIFIENNQLEMGTNTNVTVVDDDTGVNPTNDASRVFYGNNVVWANTGTVLFDVAHRGNWTVQDNTFQVTGGTEYAATSTFDSDGSANGRLVVKIDNNSLRNSDAAQSTRPEVWLPTIGSGVIVKLPTLVAETPPSFCIEGQVLYDGDETSGQRIFACESGSFVLQGDGGGGGGAGYAEIAAAALAGF